MYTFIVYLLDDDLYRVYLYDKTDGIVGLVMLMMLQMVGRWGNGLFVLGEGRFGLVDEGEVW